jgi:methyltransferase (TIGR00027 family)
MDERIPSLTALGVAFARAAYAEAPFAPEGAADHIASRLLPRGLSHLARAMPLAWRAPMLTHRVLHAIGLGFAEHVALRTAAIDAALDRAMLAGIRQVVILGAGLDARAYRMASLARAIVFEVDYPSTQRYKRRHVSGLETTAREVRFVSVDFERDAIGDRLALHGHDPTVRTFWLWEGVTPYLPHAVTEATLAMIRGRSVAGSEVALTYVAPEHLGFARGMEIVLRNTAAVIREPLHGVITRDALHAIVERNGFTVLEDSDTCDWAERYWPAAQRAGDGARERLLVARVPPPYTEVP